MARLRQRCGRLDGGSERRDASGEVGRFAAEELPQHDISCDGVEDLLKLRRHSVPEEVAAPEVGRDDG